MIKYCIPHNVQMTHIIDYKQSYEWYSCQECNKSLPFDIYKYDLDLKSYSNKNRPKPFKFPFGYPIWNTDDQSINYCGKFYWYDADGVIT